MLRSFKNKLKDEGKLKLKLEKIIDLKLIDLDMEVLEEELEAAK